MANRERKNILSLSPTELDTLIKAWVGIQALPPTDGNSFYAIATYHGQPFRGAGWGNSSWWGGYCNHGNVLFPTWHRAYLWRLEEALRSIDGCGTVTLPYWDQMTNVRDNQVIPDIFLAKTYTFSGTATTISNPLYSYKLQAAFTDRVGRASEDYSKYKNYETVRYPFSGLVGVNDRQATEVHNERINNMGTTAIDSAINDNVRWWLDEGPNNSSLRLRYLSCLIAPNYTVFSNTTSALKWNDDHKEDSDFRAVVPLESPHNGLHLAVGGYSIPGAISYDLIAGANGDMGENDTASFDPIFYFHHSFIDRVFWSWQKRNHNTTRLEILNEYPGTNSVDDQGPTPGMLAGQWLRLEDELKPFGVTSIVGITFPPKLGTNPIFPFPQQMANIEVSPLGYSYDSLLEAPRNVVPAPSVSHIRASGISRATTAGSFVVSVWASKTDQDPTLLGFEPVLSRWHVAGCANCNNHLAVGFYLPLSGWGRADITNATFTTVVHTSKDRDGGEFWGPGEEVGHAEPVFAHN